jgi:serine/threonine-protein kinase RsbW
MTLLQSTPRSVRQVFDAKMAQFPQAAAFLQGYCERLAIGKEAGLRATLILEELFTNTVAHGLEGEGATSIGIELSQGDGVLSLLYEDDARCFDPLPRLHAVPERLNAPLEVRPQGGLGLHIVGQLVTSARHAYEAGRNRLWLTIALEPGRKP